MSETRNVAAEIFSIIGTTPAVYPSPCLLRRPAAATRMEFAIPIPGEVNDMALSADGSTRLRVARRETGLPMLYVQRVGSPNATVLTATEGASYPFLSPNGANVAFFANCSSWRRLRTPTLRH